jgi:carboxyl-terminal processing protease
MPLTRRALILSATAASVLAPLASAALSHPSAPLPNGLWRSRSTADLVVFDQRARRTYTCYSSAVALVDESPLEEIERETLDAQLENDSRLELEYWGTVTRFQYDRINDWPTPPPLGNGNWVSDPGMTVDAFFEVLAGHFAFARERGLDWRALRAECDAALRRGPVTPDHLFDTLAATLRHLEDGHGSLSDRERYAESRSSTSRLYQAWKAAGGRPLDGDSSAGFHHDWLDHVQGRILLGAGHLAAQDVVAWGQLPSGVGYISLMLCESLSEVEGGHADVEVARQTFDRILRDLAGVRGIIVDLRFNNGGWDRVPLALASHFTDRTLQAFTKQPVRRGVGLDTQTIEITPAGGARYTGPVAVLTSDATISAAEVGTLGLRARPNTRSFGRPTYGALSDPFYYRLPNGWKGAVSNEIYRASDGQVYEGVGIPPDHPSAEPSASAFWETLDAQLRDAETWLLAL